VALTDLHSGMPLRIADPSAALTAIGLVVTVVGALIVARWGLNRRRGVDAPPPWDGLVLMASGLVVQTVGLELE
jgi:hypothetical protein